MPLIGDGHYPQYLVHEDDLANSVVRAAMSTESQGHVSTIAHPQPWLLRDLIQRIAAEQGKRVKFIGLPWRMIYGGLKTAESLGLKLSFRSDSVISLVYQNPAPQFASDLPLRAFQ